ncbi:MAG: DUF4835 family protein [Marinilabiliales bacterium]
MIKKTTILLILIFINITTFFAQELNCRVQIQHQQIQGSNTQIFQTLQNAIFEFMNNTKWTDHVFSMDERIECNIMINITQQLSTDEYKATIQVQSTRPVYNTTYNSVLLNYQDNDFQFQYVEFQPLDFSLTTFNSNLTSVLAYYAYIIIGLDYDSFSLNGGTEFFQKAETIVNNAQSAKEAGWKAFESNKNRYWLVENLLQKKYSGVRECIYQYHRLGLDVMSEKPADGRAVIAESLKLIQKVYRAQPGCFILQLFFNAKADEIVNIFSESFTDEKNRVYNILQEVDPANLTKYKKILQTQQ